MNEQKLILVVEHDADEVFLFERALKKLGVINPIRVLRYADEAKCYLSGIGGYANRELFPLPALLILDLDLPSQSGMELVDWIRRNRRLDQVPIVGLTDGSERSQIQRHYDRGVNAWFRKRLDVFETVELIRDLEFLDDILKHQEEDRL